MKSVMNMTKVEDEPIREIQPGREYEVLGLLRELDDVNEAPGTKLESEDYDSVGGYIIEQLDWPPTRGRICHFGRTACILL